jgi:uncharacterized protein (TIGR04255 family)
MNLETAGPFPASKRVHYRNAPLTQVVGQFRFPPILRIQTEPPSAFQDSVRSEFPLLERPQVQLPPGLQLPPEIMQAVRAQVAPGGWAFLTEDRSTTISLMPDSISLSTTNYDRWERFRALMLTCLEALTSVYRPAYFSRVGLRYQDQILRSKLNLVGRPWSQLLSREIQGEIASPEIEANLLELRKAVRVALPALGGSVFLQHGLAKTDPQSEAGYMIDFDFSRDQKTEATDVATTIENLHHGVGAAFRWCISDELHRALDPLPID